MTRRNELKNLFRATVGVLLLATASALAENNLKFGKPDCPGRLLDKQFFVICYSPEHKIPIWVGYALTAADLDGPATRTNNFRADPALPADERSRPKDYSKSGYDQGHMAPAEDFTRSIQAMSTTFLLSNMAPQRPGLNRNRWKQLENAGRRVAKSQGSVWLFTGSIFIGNKPIQEIGADKVAVPTHFYKVILCVHPDGTKEMFASVMPNIAKLQTGLGKYATSVDNVEQLTGLDFFSALSESEQKSLESKVGSLP